VLFSGGLDSRIVVKLLQEQNIETELVYFSLPFGCGCCNNLSCNFNFAQISKAQIHIIDCTKGKLFEEYLNIIKSPKYGYGKGINPCIHCRIFMFKHAKSLMKKLNCQFIASGEVLGQRPMSQYKKALMNIEKEAGLKGLILRPLSAKLLNETIAEKKKLVDRDKLLAIKGRQRNIQIALAKKYGIKFPDPAGGCLLCDHNYSKKLKDLFEYKKIIKSEDIEILNGFRHFRKTGKIILGRNQVENLKLEELNKKLKYNIIISPRNKPGPTCLYEDAKDDKLAQDLVEVYSSKDLKQRSRFDELRV
jgi:tRNA U34 2-thiouridine synthase MnmA/TrmU